MPVATRPSASRAAGATPQGAQHLRRPHRDRRTRRPLFDLRQEPHPGADRGRALSVDGLDVLDGKSASTRKRGYVIAPAWTPHCRWFSAAATRVSRRSAFGSEGSSYGRPQHRKCPRRRCDRGGDLRGKKRLAVGSGARRPTRFARRARQRAVRAAAPR